MTNGRPLEPVLGVAEIATFLGIKRPNVRKMVARYNIEPVAELAVGPVFLTSRLYTPDEVLALLVEGGVPRAKAREMLGRPDHKSIVSLKAMMDGDAARVAKNAKIRATARARQGG